MKTTRGLVLWSVIMGAWTAAVFCALCIIATWLVKAAMLVCGVDTVITVLVILLLAFAFSFAWYCILSD